MSELQKLEGLVYSMAVICGEQNNTEKQKEAVKWALDFCHKNTIYLSDPQGEIFLTKSLKDWFLEKKQK